MFRNVRSGDFSGTLSSSFAGCSTGALCCFRLKTVANADEQWRPVTVLRELQTGLRIAQQQLPISLAFYIDPP
jgi:hypothetical protein